MPAPRYDVRAGFLPSNWVEIASKYPTWDMIVGNFRWEELMAGPVPDVDVEEININREVGTIFNRLAMGQCRMQLANSRGQYTNTGSLMNLAPYSDDLSSGTYWIGAAASTSLNVIVGKTGAIDADVLSENNAATFHTLKSPASMAISPGSAMVIAAEFYPGTRDRLLFRFGDAAEASYFDAAFSVRSLTAVANAAAGTATALGASLQALTDGWVRCWVSGTLPTSTGLVGVYMVNSAGVSSYAGTGSAWIGVRAFQIQTGLFPNDFLPTANSLAILPREASLDINDVLTIKCVDGSSLYNLFSGYLDRWDANPSLVDLQKIALTASDIANRLRPMITTSLFVNATHKTLLTAIMSEAHIDPTQYRIDQMNDHAPFAFLDQVTAGQALAQIQASGAQVYYVNGGGTLVMRSRHWDVSSTTCVGSYGVAFGMTLTQTADEVTNRVQVMTTPRFAFPDVTTVAYISDAIFVPAGSSRQFLLDFVDPVTNESGVPVRDIQPQRRGTDYILNTAPNGDGSDITSQVNVVASLNATSAVFTVSNGGGTNGYLSTCQLRGFPVRQLPDIAATVANDASIARFQERFAQFQADLLQNESQARGFAEFLIVQYADPLPTMQVQLMNEWPDVFARELLDRVFVASSLLQVSSSHYVKALEHTITWKSGLQHTLALTVEPLRIKNWFTLDSSTLGRLDYNRLGF